MEEGVNPESYELWLQERCQRMLQDFLVESIAEGFTSKSSLRQMNVFIERFMKAHNLK
jgi:hypothetical protein